MSAKNTDKYNRWRNITIGFRVTPEEAYQIDIEAKTSGMSKQDYITARLLNKEITVRPNIRIQHYLEKYLIDLTAELKRLSNLSQPSDILENITYIVNLISQMTDKTNTKENQTNDWIKNYSQNNYKWNK